jgi:nucleoside-diphosphate-sugar epimerase
MRILLVGGMSSISRALIPKLLEFGEVITAGRTNCDITLDLNNLNEEIKFPSEIDIVINTAASFGGISAKEILETENVNVLGTLRLCEAAKVKHVKHFILISSIFATLNANSKNYSIYALSKKHSEDIARYYCTLNKLPLCILRPSQIYGIGDEFRKHQPFFYLMIDKAQNNEDIELFGTNDPKRNYIYIDDLTNIIVRVIHNNIEGTYSCVHQRDLTYSEIAMAAFKAFNTNGKVLFLKDQPDIPDNIFEIDNYLYNKIGFYPEISIEEGINKIATHLKLAK